MGVVSRTLLLDDSDAKRTDPEEDSFQPPIAGLVTGWRTLLSQGTGPTGERELDKAVFMWLDTALKRSELKSLILQTLRQAVDIPGSEGPKLREALRTCAAGWVQGQDRPYDEARENIRHELAMLLDDDLLRRRQSGKDKQAEPESELQEQGAQQGTQNMHQPPDKTGADAA